MILQKPFLCCNFILSISLHYASFHLGLHGTPFLSVLPIASGLDGHVCDVTCASFQGVQKAASMAMEPEVGLTEVRTAVEW